MRLRASVAAYIKARGKFYAPFIEGEVAEYVRQVRKGAWGDHFTLQAIADMTGFAIKVVRVTKNFKVKHTVIKPAAFFPLGDG